jgi:chorismate mutase/prephenate dehydratase
MTSEIEGMRGRLDEVDASIVTLLSERFQLIDEIARMKQRGRVELQDADRENALLARVAQLAEAADLNPALVQRIFREILDYSLRRQLANVAQSLAYAESAAGAVSAAYQGIEASYSHMAASRHLAGLSPEARLIGFHTFHEVAAAVTDGSVTFGFLPIENTTAGSINAVHDLLAETDLHIIGEEIQVVDHCLIGLPGTHVEDLKRIRSHPEALAQCGRFLRSVPWCRAEAYDDTAMAARQVHADGDPTEAAIASEAAADRYGLEILRRRVADQPRNLTRFVVVGRAVIPPAPGLAYKTSVVLVLKHEVGSLSRCLVALADSGINVSKIESRPLSNTPWQYRFYLDFAGHQLTTEVQGGLAELRRYSESLRVLGSYPAISISGSQADGPFPDSPADMADPVRPDE